ncbi:carboxypeptidase-like protein S1 [Coniochaeta ligniaria NRRL 30616]|uniref:Carboxypeptidase n=1 Tax=Coniochaeta ligniaria NRRL 30616 TaxID=1408157 RepID=A0A1J7IVW5_9PEZI|nr:carboxypeptidase-like protein S1 [Coniochaeta ligniaria NRRL 30616]
MRVSTLAALALPCLAAALPATPKDKRYTEVHGGTNYTVFEHAATAAKLSFVTNSGICETTPGVNQYSGYLSVGTNMNMWFWFFESRSSPSTAPLAMWLNGGPGCSSMIGLFQENGPCHFVNGASTPSLNPYSFNTYANMLYVDQPIGTGFSYGTDDVTSTVTAAPFVWQFMQAFYAAFPQYENRDFGLFTESYGGHYGPEFASYFQSQNAKIASGSVSGQTIDLVALGINNGWIDPVSQYKAYPDFAYNNTYKKLITASQYSSYISAYNSKCVPAMAKCTGLTGSNSACTSADNTCYSAVEGPIENANDFDVYDVRAPSNDPNPPETYVTYLQSSSVVKAIGAKSTYAECPNVPYQKISSTGDGPRSFLSTLSTVVQSGIQVLVWAGDADWICNWMGNFAAANSLTWSGKTTFASKAVAPYTVNGTSYGEFKSVSNLSWLRVYGAGHEVPFYQPKVALQAFWQTLQKKPLSST